MIFQLVDIMFRGGGGNGLNLSYFSKANRVKNRLTNRTDYLAYSWSVQCKWRKWAKPFIILQESAWKDTLTNYTKKALPIAGVGNTSLENGQFFLQVEGSTG